MPKFRYKAHNTAGKVFEGEIEAATSEDVGSKLRNDMGMFVLNIENVQGSIMQSPALLEKIDPLEELGQWTPPQGATVKAGAIHPPVEDEPVAASQDPQKYVEPAKRPQQEQRLDIARNIVKTKMEKLAASLRILKEFQDHPGQIAVGDKTWQLVNASVPAVVESVINETIRESMLYI